jgi:hypothetical protein
MPSYTMTKGGERVRVNSNADRDELIANGYVVETDSEQDPQDKVNKALDVSTGKLSLGVKASAPTGPNAVGDLYVATGGVLKVCTVAGSPGTWVSVGTQT